MAAHETRLLILGAVALFEPVNGYQIRRELVSWEVDRWAHVNPGSIYHALGTLARAGHLVRHDLTDGAREVAVYELTSEGRAELDRLMVEALESVDPFDRIAFSAAFSMLPLLGREQVLRSLTRRRATLEQVVRDLGGVPDGVAPPHARRAQLLWLDVAVAELGWLRETIEEIKGGRLPFEQGADWGWRPAEDDPGWQMVEDRERYLRLLGR